MGSTTSMPASTPETRRDMVAAIALTMVRRALVEGVPVTRAGLTSEACVNLDASPDEAMKQVDAVAQRVGVSSLS